MNGIKYIFRGVINNLNSIQDEISNIVDPLDCILTDFKVENSEFPSEAIIEVEDFCIFHNLKNGQLYHYGYKGGTFNNSSKMLQFENDLIEHLAHHTPYTFAITQSNKTYYWKNYNFNRPNLVDIKFQSKVKSLTFGAEVKIILTEDGVCQLEQTQDGWILQPIPVGSHRVTQVSCGLSHTLLLTSSGVVLSMGRGSQCQLGHGSTSSLQDPEVIEALEGLKMVAVAAGGSHSVAIAESGDVYVWGYNKDGQLGLPAVVQPEPRPLDLPANFMAASCGVKHTLLLTDGGEVWGMGCNHYGQLGDIVAPGPSCLPLPGRAVGVKCSEYSSCIALETSKFPRLRSS